MKYQVMPDLTPIEYEALKNDIAEHGVLVPVEVDEHGDLLDGHHRARAWEELKAEGHLLPDYPRMIRAGMTEEEKRNHARRLNVVRRHLTKDQRNGVIVDMRKDGMSYREIAEAVGVTHPTVINTVKNLGGKSLPPEDLPVTVTGKDGKEYPSTKTEKPKPQPGLFASNSTSQVNTISALRSLKERAPDLHDKAMSGELKITAAQREASHREKRNPPPLPTSKYRVVYADPPWSYGNSGIIGDTDNYGRAERHYPTMSIDELCAMGAQVREMADDNAVLFMWVTSPLLEECFPVIKAWGFKYKTSFVWDKVRHNYGHYNSVRHELLLICTRGSCTPDVPKLFDSVVEYERTDNHSEKPEHFREMIDTLYPHGKRIELFARRAVDGWHGWGNE